MVYFWHASTPIVCSVILTRIGDLQFLKRIHWQRQYSLALASDSCSWLTGVEPDVVFCCCCPSASGFEALFYLRRFSARHGCKVWLFESSTLKAVWPWTDIHWPFCVYCTILWTNCCVWKIPAASEILKPTRLPRLKSVRSFWGVWWDLYLHDFMITCIALLPYDWLIE